MPTYGYVVWGQTLLALAALGLAGGWVLWPFRAPNRPYLWLAAPLAGIPALGVALLALYYGCRMHVMPSLAVGWGGLSAATLACLLRSAWPILSRRTVVGKAGRVSEAPAATTASSGQSSGVSARLPMAGVGNQVVAILALAIGNVWGTYVCNHDSIKAGEPTLAIYEGSDQFGYSMVAEWLLAHSGGERPQPSLVVDVLPYANLNLEGSRHAAFLLTASAALVRGTTPTFSYDWTCGVVLSAAVLGLAGLFASGPVGLWLLLVAGMTSSWLTVARTSYLGKTLAYPGCVLLCALYLRAWARPSRGRILAACLIAPGVAFCINPILPPLTVGLLLGGVMLALAVHRLLGRPAPDWLADRSVSWRTFGRAVMLYLALTTPTLTFHRFAFPSGGYPPYALPWNLAIPASLDLQNPYLAMVSLPLLRKLILVLVAMNGLLLLEAFRRRNVPAQALLLTTGLVPAAYLMGRTEVYGFHGLLYPMTAAGAVLLLESPWRRWRSALSAAAVVALTGGMVATHLPQAYSSGKRYLTRANASYPVVYKQSEAAAIRDLVGNQTLDACSLNVHDSCFVMSELAYHGTPVNLLSPGWDWSLKNWARAVGYVEQPPPPKARYQLTTASAYAPPGTVRYRSARFQLIEDGGAVTLRRVNAKFVQTTVWDEHRRPGIYQGSAPTDIEIYNGTENTAHVRFLAEGRPLSTPVGDASRRTLRYRLGDQEGVVVLGPTAWELDVPLALSPGSHLLTVSVEDARTPPARPGQLDPLLWLTNLRLAPSAGSSTVGAFPQK